MELMKRSMQEVTKLGGKRITMEVGVNEVLVQFLEAIKRDSSVGLLDEIFEGFIISNQVRPDNWAIQPEIGFFVKCRSSVISTQTIELSTYVLTQVDQVLLGRWITSSVDSKETDEITPVIAHGYIVVMPRISLVMEVEELGPVCSVLDVVIEHFFGPCIEATVVVDRLQAKHNSMCCFSLDASCMDCAVVQGLMWPVNRSRSSRLYTKE